MSRYAHAQTTPGQPTFEGDEQFVGMDLETARWLLPPGMVHYSQNYRLASGRGVKRGGIVTPLFANVQTFGQIRGSEVFADPNREKVMLIATASLVWKISDGGYPMAIALAAGVTLSGPVEFTQNGARIKLHCAAATVAPATTPAPLNLVWDGSGPGKFELETISNVALTERERVPASEWSVNFAGRSLFPTSPREFGASDFVVSDWDPILKRFPATDGKADTLIGLFPYAHSNLIVGSRDSITRYQNFVGALTNISAQTVNSSIGVVARKSWQMFGADALFLSRRGVYRINQVDQDRVETSPIPIGAHRDDKGKVIDPIGPILRRINWKAAHLTVSGIDGPYYVLAVPIDGSSVNNALLYFNTVSDRWESVDLFDPRALVQIDNLLAFDYDGETRLYAINHRTNSVHILNEGKFDETASGRWEIPQIFRSRGYATLGWNATVRRDFKRVVIAVATWRPKVTVQEVTEGAHDSRTIARDLTKDRRKFDKFDRKPFVLTNVNDDALEPGRQDYSVELYGADEINLGSGVDLEAKQESVLGAPGGFSTKCRGRYIGYDITNTQGDCDVLGILAESDGEQRTQRAAA